MSDTRIPTRFRHVWREVSDGNQTVTVLALQQYFEKPSEKGAWEDVEIHIGDRNDN